jgi:hypothetical protein
LAGAELAAATGSDEVALGRLLVALATAGGYEQQGDKRHASTELGNA